MLVLFIFQAGGIDQQHAIIEYSDQEDCYVLQDLNTAQGTYVNDVRVQNAAVRLAPGDIIRFGFGGTPYELNIENPPPVSICMILLTGNVYESSSLGLVVIDIPVIYHITTFHVMILNC